jgi:hypothetical protein
VYPQSPGMRRKRTFLKLFGVGEEAPAERLDVTGTEDRFHTSKHGRYMVSSRHLGASLPSSSAAAPPLVQQYRLQAVRPKSSQNACLRWIGLGDTKFTIYEGAETEPACSCLCYNPNQLYVFLLFFSVRLKSVVIPLILTLYSTRNPSGSFGSSAGSFDKIYALLHLRQLFFV